MSFRLEMLQVARVAPKALGESADLVTAFIQSQFHPAGGFMDREGKPDLYYTVFGIEALLALQAEVPWAAIHAWLEPQGAGEGLDFVHLCCLARCWASVDAKGLSEEAKDRLLGAVEGYRAANGGYHQAVGREYGTAYGSLLGWSAYQDLGRESPEVPRLIESLMCLRAADGAWSNERNQPFGMVPATAAAVALFRHLQLPIPAELVPWLKGQLHGDGGFCVFPGVPLPDLLSTAVALHALDALQVDLGGLREPCLDFIDSLWSADGGFHGNWTDDDLDCEYTYYGLLSLGHLTL